MKMLAFDSVPISFFAYLAAGRAHEALDDEQLRSLLHGIAAREGGAKVTAAWRRRVQYRQESGGRYHLAEKVRLTYDGFMVDASAD